MKQNVSPAMAAGLVIVVLVVLALVGYKVFLSKPGATMVTGPTGNAAYDNHHANGAVGNATASGGPSGGPQRGSPDHAGSAGASGSTGSFHPTNASPSSGAPR